MKSNLRQAWASIRAARWRSLFTMLGVIIGVTSVVTTLSLGEGLKRQVSKQINQFGPDLVTIRSGKSLTKNDKGQITSVNFLSSVASSTLTDVDVTVIRQTPDIKTAVPITFINAETTVEDRHLPDGLVLGVSGDVPSVLNQKVVYGSFFNADEQEKPVAVIGRSVATQLFKENVPIGKTMNINSERFVVVGVFDDFPSSPLLPGGDFNHSVFIPFNTAKRLSNGNAQIIQILVRPNSGAKVDDVVAKLQAVILASHNNQENFTILRQSDNLALSSNLLGLITNFIAAIAGVSLFVGGIGIMNIMLVAVTERTYEIGIRKSVGASNAQILSQFLSEAVLLSFIGGIIGLSLSLIGMYLISLLTPLQPFITWQLASGSVVVSVLIGVLFGTVPAFKAARKHPIDALRQP